MKEKAAGLTLPRLILALSSRSKRAPTRGNRCHPNLEMPTHARVFPPLSTVTEVSCLKAHSPGVAPRARARKNARLPKQPSRAVSTWPRRGSKRLGPWKVSVRIKKWRRRAPPAPARPSVLIAAHFWRQAIEMCGRCGACRRGVHCPGKTWEYLRKRSEVCSLARTDGGCNSLVFRHLSAGWPSSALTVPWQSWNCNGRYRPVLASEGGERKAWCYLNSYCRAAIRMHRKYFLKGAKLFFT